MLKKNNHRLGYKKTMKMLSGYLTLFRNYHSNVKRLRQLEAMIFPLTIKTVC